MQFRQAQTEFASLRHLQQDCCSFTVTIWRHNLVLLQVASQGLTEEINEYRRFASVRSWTDITPLRFCGKTNLLSILILSAFASKAKQSGFLLTVLEAKLPRLASVLSDTELCYIIVLCFGKMLYMPVKI
jgi:hypothetical protein